MKILSWNCDGGFFRKGKYKSILKYNADILVIQECSDPDKSINQEYEENPHYKKYEVENFMKLYPNHLWSPDYEKDEIDMEDENTEKKHKDKLGQEGIAFFAKKIILEKKLDWNDKCDEEITWWSEKETKLPIIKNKKLKAFYPVYIKQFDLLVLGVHTKAPEKPNKYKYMGQIQKYLKNNDDKLNKYKNIIIAGDLNAGFKECDCKKYNELIELYDENYNLKNCIQNYSVKFIPTHYRPDGIGYIDDFIFISKILNINSKPTNEWEPNKKGKKKWGYINEENKGSDHCPLIVEIENIIT